MLVNVTRLNPVTNTGTQTYTSRATRRGRNRVRPTRDRPRLTRCPTGILDRLKTPTSSAHQVCEDGAQRTPLPRSICAALELGPRGSDLRVGHTPLQAELKR